MKWMIFIWNVEKLERGGKKTTERFSDKEVKKENYFFFGILRLDLSLGSAGRSNRNSR